MILPLEPVLRDYAWGSTSALQHLIGTQVDGSPLAEIWLGAHPSDPAHVRDVGVGTGELAPLDRWLQQHPAELGAEVEHRFGRRLPYLLKVLAAERALSLQVHPTSARAAEGFADEEKAGIDAGAPTRRYRDPFHKPEMVIAITEFHALCGLRPVSEIVRLLGALGLSEPSADYLLDLLMRAEPAEGLRSAFEFLLSGDSAVAALVSDVVEAARRNLDADPIGEDSETFATVVTLAQQYPGDPGVVVSLLLNRVTLAPGEALYLEAGNVHAYLSGTAVEVMATSDNVIRAGLTPKHVDVEELLSVVEFEPLPLPLVKRTGDDQVTRYRPGASEFQLDWVEADGQTLALQATGPRILLCLGGDFEVSSAGQSLTVGQGQSLFVGATEGDLKLTGSGAAVLVSVPL